MNGPFDNALKHGGLALVGTIGAAYFRALFSALNFKTEPWPSVCDAVFAGSLVVALVSVAAWFRRAFRRKKI